MTNFGKNCSLKYKILIILCVVFLCWIISQHFFYGNINTISFNDIYYNSNGLIIKYIHKENETKWDYNNAWFSFRGHIPPLDELFSKQILIQKHNTFMHDIKLLYRDFAIIQSKPKSCFKEPNINHQCGVHCAGIGANIIYGSHCIHENIKEGISTSMNESNCDWGKHDLTKKCDTFFNCYLIGEIKWEPKKYNDDSICDTNTAWFVDKYSDLIHHAALLTYFWNGYTLYDNHGIFKLHHNDCICVHIRRGDACYTKLRDCYPIKTYIDAAILMRFLYKVNNIKLLTDAHDVDVIIDMFKKHNFNIIYTNDKLNRTNLNTQEIPENRKNELGASPIKEYIDDINNGVQCKLLIGTFSSSMTKLLFSLMMIKHQYIPPFYSPDGCASDAYAVTIHGPCAITDKTRDNIQFYIRD